MVMFRLNKGKWKWATTVIPLVIVGGTAYLIVRKKFGKVFHLPFQVLDQEKKQCYIVARSDERSDFTSSGFQFANFIEDSIIRIIPTKIVEHLPPWFLHRRALLHQRYQSPWQLLQDVTPLHNEMSQTIIDKINNHSWQEKQNSLSEQDLLEDYEYRLLGHNLKPSYICALARTKNVDERFFLKPKQLTPFRDENILEYKLYNLLTKLPRTDEDECLQYFTHGALEISDERQLKKGGKWCFGGNGLNYTREIVSQEKVESFCLQALVKHSKFRYHCEAMVKLSTLELLQQIHLLRQDAIDMQRNIVRIISNICFHEGLHSHVLASGWLSYLVQLSKSDVLPIRMESMFYNLILLSCLYLHESEEIQSCISLVADGKASRALANLDRKYLEHKYLDGVYEIYPRHRTEIEPAVDIVLIHGLLGGAFHTWRQRDSESTVEGPICWPETWLPQDLPNIRVLSVEYDTHLSDWLPHCPYRKESRNITFRSHQILEKLRVAGVGQKRPVIWIVHSMGGLVLKNMLIVANDKDVELRKMVTNTKGIVFYSTPHFGSQLAEYSRKVRKLLFPSVEVMNLSHDSPQLHQMNDGFNKLLAEYRLNVLSFGELQSTSIGLGKVKIHIVPPESADIGAGPLILCDTDHLNICKPASRYSTLYQRTIEFISSCLRDFKDESK